MRYIYNILMAIDQLGNALAGGYHDTTISARVGFFAREAKNGRIYWQFLEKVIDFTFYPLDGKGHSYKAYLEDKDENFHAGNTFAYIFLSFFIFLFTPLIALILYPAVFLFPKLRMVKSDNDNDANPES